MREDKKYLKYWGKARQRKDGVWECHLLPYHNYLEKEDGEVVTKCNHLKT